MPAALAGAQEALPLDVTPTSGWAGGRVTVAGQGCLNEGGVTGLVSVLLFGDDGQSQFTVNDVLDDGSWSTVITLPEALALGPHLLTGICAFPGGVEVDYAPVDFDVIDRTVLDVTPTSGSVGSQVTVSGQGCLNESGAIGLVSVLLLGDDDERQFTVTDVRDDGSWSTVITLPEGLAPGPHMLTAICAFSGGGEFDYAPVGFVVIDATASPPSTTTTTVGTPAPEPASPARPVPGEPTFTG